MQKKSWQVWKGQEIFGVDAASALYTVFGFVDHKGAN